MKKTLVILAHPNIEESIGNKIITDHISLQEGTEIRHLNKLYPDFKIDIKKEQEALLKADTIIFQYPLFWYSTPAILKEWIDQVMQYGFAFGAGGFQLANKKIIVSFTMGSPSKDYSDEIIQKITFPFQGLANYCKMNYAGEIYSFDINNYSEGAEEKAISNAINHAEQLIELTK